MWNTILQSFTKYRICGRVKSLHYNKAGKERMLKACKSPQGYLYVNLCKNGKAKTFAVHQLVATAFIPNPNSLPEVNHKWGIKTDNRASELEWVSYSENLVHAYKTGLNKRVKQVNQCDLQGNFIRTWESQREAERQLNINQRSISYCCLGKRKTAGRLYMEIQGGVIMELEKYIDKDGKEFVVLTDKNGISEVRFVRDLIIEAFGNADEYDKIMQKGD